MDKMNLDKVSDEVIQDLFTESFEQKGADNDISEFECTCKREVGSSKIGIEVMVVGMAGTVPYNEIHDKEIPELETITIGREGDGSLDFERDPESDYVLNTNDYVVVYKSV